MAVKWTQHEEERPWKSPLPRLHPSHWFKTQAKCRWPQGSEKSHWLIPSWWGGSTLPAYHFDGPVKSRGRRNSPISPSPAENSNTGCGDHCGMPASSWGFNPEIAAGFLILPKTTNFFAESQGRPLWDSGKKWPLRWGKMRKLFSGTFSSSVDFLLNPSGGGWIAHFCWKLRKISHLVILQGR